MFFILEANNQPNVERKILQKIPIFELKNFNDFPSFLN
jgi:hypothetical protein